MIVLPSGARVWLACGYTVSVAVAPRDAFMPN
jgi:hypothetical protein